MLSFLPRDVLDEIWDLTESVSEGFPTFSCRLISKNTCILDNLAGKRASPMKLS